MTAQTGELPLAGLRAVVTGASSGIGRAIAIAFSAAGARVGIGFCQSAEAARALADELGGDGKNPLLQADLGTSDGCTSIVNGAFTAFEHVDVWVNNAGRGITKPVLELTDEEFDLIMAANVKSALYGMQAIAPHFLERKGGHIVNVSSMLSRVPFATYRSAYNAAKHALNALTANARVDLHAKCPDVHVTLVMPGLVSTDFAKNALGGSPPPPRTPAQTPEEVAAAIVNAIDRPVAEVYTNPALAGLAVKYLQDVEAFEREQAMVTR